MKKITIFKIALALACAPLVTNAAVLNRQLQIGMTGSDVSWLQTFLAQDSSIYPQGLVTGYFGSLTKAAVARFQSRNGIPAVGRVGPQTMAFINNLMNSGGGTPITSGTPILNVPSVTTSGSQATISWTSSLPTTSAVYYSSSPISMFEATDTTSFGVNSPAVRVNSTGVLGTVHSVALSGLNPNTTYYYVVYGTDSSGTEHIRLPVTFTTTSF